MPVTIYDVAKQASVGIGTVSRVINNSSQITEKTKEKVLSVIKELNYQPHIVAQSLARRKTNSIGCIIPFFTGYFFVELLRGIQRKISFYKNELILYSVDDVSKKETFLSKALEERRVDGILLVSLDISSEYVQKIKEKNFPVVLLDSYHDELDSIKVNNEDGAFQATTHLINCGYKKIAMITGVMTSLPSITRFEGYQKAIAKAEIDYDERYFISGDCAPDADGFNKEAGYLGMKRLLDLGKNRPEAIFAASDIQAVGALRAIREAGLKAPEDIAIIGFDDIELSEHLGLTTVRQPTFQMAELAVTRLMEKINGKNDDVFVKRVDTELIIRDTCGFNFKKNKNEQVKS